MEKASSNKEHVVTGTDYKFVKFLVTGITKRFQ